MLVRIPRPQPFRSPSGSVSSDSSVSARLVWIAVTNQVDFGDHRRSIVAGLKNERDDPREIAGRQALFVVNLPRRTMAGVVSEGMLFDIGYADGVRRHLTGRLKVMIGERRYPVVGTITMDQIMVDVGDDPVEVGANVLIWGDAEYARIQVLDIAEAMASIPYEMTCGISRRVPRVVVNEDCSADSS